MASLFHALEHPLVALLLVWRCLLDKALRLVVAEPRDDLLLQPDVNAAVVGLHAIVW